jgi:hypothetical protein
VSVRAGPLGFALIAMAVSGAVRAQPAPAPPPAALQNGLFGVREPEPGDEAEAAGQTDPAAQAAPTTENYDARVRQSFAAAESFRGPLDGGWTLSAKREEPLYVIRFSDNQGQLEAAWRDLRRGGALDASGLVEQVERQGDRLTLSFTSAAGVRNVATLKSRPDGAWAGELDENGRKRKVTLRKTSP